MKSGAPQAASKDGLASAWMIQWSNVPPLRGMPVAWRHHIGLPASTATSVLTCSPVSSSIQKWPGATAAGYSAADAMGRLPVPMPRRFTIGLENTGKCGGITPCGAEGRSCDCATASLS